MKQATLGRPESNPAGMMDALLAHLRKNHPTACRHWFDGIESLGVANGTLRLLVRESVQLRYLQRACTAMFQEAAQAVTSHLLAVQFVGESEALELTIGAPPAPHGGMGQTGHGALSGGFAGTLAEPEMLLSPDYSFSNYIVGPDNRLAHAAAIAVAKKPGAAYNPLFVHSAVGLGKTHLLQAICQQALRDDSSRRIYFTSCDDFMTRFMEAVQNGQMSSFRHLFRSVDILLIDDIHDLADRERAQEEFFHTFNSLYQAGKQIILSSDASPHEIPHLEERLTSRFTSGLVVRIDRPCFETRIEILRSKARLRGIVVPDDVLSYIAAKIDSNIRELEGAMTRLQSLCVVLEADITMELAKQAIGEPASDGITSNNPTIQQILDTITRFFDVKLVDLLSKRRHKSIALPRQIGMWLARRHTRYSLEEIGGYFGGRDHTTVMHAIRTVDSRRQGDSGLDQDVSRLEQLLVEVKGGDR